MALKNRDGSDFKLNKPNPLMAAQQAWDRGVKLIFHNKFGKIVTVTDTTPPAKPIPLPQTEENMKNFWLDQPKAAEPVVVETLEEPEVGIAESDKVQVWCLPASFKEY